MRLVPTERHVEAALAMSAAVEARTVRAFLRDLGLRHPRGLAAATPEATELATAAAIEKARLPGAPIEGALDEALGELRRAGVTPDVLRRAGDDRASLLAALLEETGATLERAGLFDDRALGWIAAQVIESLPAALVPSEIALEAIGPFAPADFAWLEALARRARVVVRLPAFASSAAGAPDAFASLEMLASRASDRLLSALEERWHAANDAPELEPVAAELHFESVAAIEARSDHAEARAIVRAVLVALDEGADPERVAIVVPSLDEAFLEPLRTSLHEAAIPFAEPRGRPPVAAPAAHAALGWLGLALGPIVRDRLVDLLRCADIDPSFWREDTRGAEGSTRLAAGGAARPADLARALARLPIGADPEGTLLLEALREAVDAGEAEPWMIDALVHTLERLRRLRHAGTRRERAAELRNAYRDMRLDELPPAVLTRALAPLAGRSSLGARSPELGAFSDRAAALGAIAEGLDRLEAAAAQLGMADEPVNMLRFRAELESAIAGASAGSGGARRTGAIRIVRCNEAAGLPHDLLVVARASEDTFGPARRSSPLLDEALVSALPAGRRPPAPALEQAAAHLELAWALSMTKKAVVTRAAADPDGRVRAPVAWFSHLAGPQGPERAPASPLFAHRRPLSRREQSLARLGSGVPRGDPDLRRRVEVELERAAFFLDPQRAAGRYSGLLDVEGDRAAHEHWMSLLGGANAEQPVPLTFLEKAAGCPFAAFASRALRAVRQEDAGEALDARTRGSLVHRALHVAMVALAESPGWSSSLEEAQRRARAAVDRELARAGSPLRRAEVDRALKAVHRIVRWSIEHDPELAFWRGEQPFGASEPGSWPPLRIGEGERALYLSGRIDRIDRTADGRSIRIIDYKTGAIPSAAEADTRLFQLPLYVDALFAACSADAIAPPREARALYLGTSLPVRATAEPHQVIAGELLARKKRDAEELVAKLRAGLVPPRPAAEDLCTRCDARPLCRRPAVMPPVDAPLEEGPAT